MSNALDRITENSTDPPTPRWPSEWLRGVMEVCVLRAIADGPTYGYAIGAALGEGGLGVPKGGTLYPLLARLEAGDKVCAHWGAGDGGPGRKFYELTAQGRAYLGEMTAAWDAFHHTVDRLLAGTDDNPMLPETSPAPAHTADDQTDGTHIIHTIQGEPHD